VDRGEEDLGVVQGAIRHVGPLREEEETRALQLSGIRGGGLDLLHHREEAEDIGSSEEFLLAELIVASDELDANLLADSTESGQAEQVVGDEVAQRVAELRGNAVANETPQLQQRSGERVRARQAPEKGGE